MSEQAAANAAPAQEAPVQEASQVEQPVEGQVVEGQTDPAAPTEPTNEQLKSLVKKYKIKVDGQEFEEEVDFSKDEDIRTRLQLAKVSQKRMQEAAETRKSMETQRAQLVEFINLLKTDPRKVLTNPNIGVDIKKLATDIINAEVEEEQKSPEQKEKERLQNELQELKNKMKQEEDSRKSTEYERLKEEAYQRIDMDITNAIKVTGLPSKPYVVKKFADLLMVAAENKLPLGANDVAPLVKKQILDDIRELVGAGPDEVMEELLGKEIINRVRKQAVAKVKQPAPSASQIRSTGTSSEANKPKEAKKIPMKEFLKSLK